MAAGAGLAVSQPGTITIDVPAGADIKQVLVYWQGIFDDSSFDDDILTVEGEEIGGRVSIGVSRVYKVYRADITDKELVGPGSNTITVGGLDFDIFNAGAGILVIYDDGSNAEIDLRDGFDRAYIFSSFSTDTVPQEFFFAPSDSIRTATLAMFFSDVSGSISGGGFRPSAIEITIDKGLVTETITELNNQLDSLDGEEWDTLTVPVNIPASATTMTV